jgi:hypothetical protein
MPLKLSVTNYKVWEDALKADKAAGRHPNVEYRVQNLAIFKAEATNYSEQEAPKSNDPFAEQNQETENAVEQTVQTLETDSDPFAM